MIDDLNDWWLTSQQVAARFFDIRQGASIKKISDTYLRNFYFDFLDWPPPMFTSCPPCDWWLIQILSDNVYKGRYSLSYSLFVLLLAQQFAGDFFNLFDFVCSNSNLFDLFGDRSPGMMFVVVVLHPIRPEPSWDIQATGTFYRMICRGVAGTYFCHWSERNLIGTFMRAIRSDNHDSFRWTFFKIRSTTSNTPTKSACVFIGQSGMIFKQMHGNMQT